MASVSNDPGGLRRILFIDGQGNRRSVRLGAVSQRQAEAVRIKIEDLVSAKITGHTPADETSRWLADLDDRLYAKLARVGLAKPRESVGLKAFIDAYINGRVDIKPRTKFQLESARGYLLEHFRPDVPLRDVSPGDAEAWRLFMVGTGRADNTIRRATGRARQFFAAAVRRGLIRQNPFAGIAAAVRANHERFHYVTREDAEKIIAACPDNQWRLIVALCRFGGLRCPSEVLALSWDCIDWANDRIRVPSPKTAHHEGGASRIIPLFPELLPHLRAAFEDAEPGTTYVVTRYRDGGVNLRTQLGRIVTKAGLELWEKPFQNMRSTRETELAQTFPLHVVCRWIGNSQPVAAKHYLQVTDEHFALAVGGAQAAQNPAQNAHATGGNAPQPDATAETEAPVVSGVCGSLPEDAKAYKKGKTPRVGLEPTTTRLTAGCSTIELSGTGVAAGGAGGEPI